jgi:serine/threonine protein kinase
MSVRLRQKVPVWEVGSEPVAGYRVLEHMHRGRDLDVYDVWSNERRCRCVLKTTRPDRVRGSAARRVRREGRLLLSCTHPSLVRAYDLLETADGPVVVLEALPGATLGVLIDENGRLSTSDVGHLGVHLTSAVHYLHGRGYVHLDVKPGNIVAHRGRATLIDMSLARRPGPSRGGSGTPGYMAPEQIRGGYLGPATDVWAIGAVLYEAATGRPVVDSRHLRVSTSSDSAVSGSDVSDPGVSDSGGSDSGASDWSGSDSVGGDPAPGGSDRPEVPGPAPESNGVVLPRPPRIRARRRLPVDIAAVLDACLEIDPARRPSVEVLAEAMVTLSGEPPDGVYPA